MGTRRWRSEGHRLRPTNRVCHPPSSIVTFSVSPPSFCQKKLLPPLAFSKPSVIFIPLKVYMVNSPSRQNLRPVAPPPLGRPVRHSFSLPHADTCLGQFEISNLRFEIPSLPVAVRKDFPASSRLNQGKNPCNQASSRQIKANAKFSMATSSGNRHPSPESPLCDFAPLRLCVKDPSSSLNQGKNPNNQG